MWPIRASEIRAAWPVTGRSAPQVPEMSSASIGRDLDYAQPDLAMRLQEKAIENLEAADRLLDTSDGELEPLNNAAASRAYYAAYAAVVDRMLRSGRRLPDKGYFKHDSLPDDAFHCRLLTSELREMLVWLRDLRVKADYNEDQVNYEEAALAAERAKCLLYATVRNA
jgi:uncharacterized protein (UPF0332 family)